MCNAFLLICSICWCVFVCVCLISFRLLWQSLNVLLSNSNEIPEWKISSHMLPLLLVSDVGFSVIFVPIVIFLLLLHFITVIRWYQAATILLCCHRHRLYVSVFFYFGISVRFDNVFYIISISSRGHHVLCACVLVLCCCFCCRCCAKDENEWSNIDVRGVANKTIVLRPIKCYFIYIFSICHRSSYSFYG